ncbi:unnamed protein product [Rotaria sp. Silwood1]|nr:unnamed protein product [Rotaria sp. Silwood1]
MSVRKVFQTSISEGSEKSLDANETVSVIVEHAAIDQRDFIESFYDGYEDNIRGKLGGKINTQLCKSTEKIKYISINGRAPEHQNLLKFVKIDYQQRLNLLLETTRANRIVLLINYSQLINKQTRLCYIHQESHIEFYNNHLDLLKKTSKIINM